MKRFIIWIFLIIGIIGTSAYLIYKFYLPGIVADAIISEETPEYVPRRIMNRVEELRTPIKKGTQDLLQEMHKADISLEELLETLDDLTEAQAYAMLDEINAKPIDSVDQVFDIAIRHIHTDFDAEVFREPFKRNVTLKQIKKMIKFANINRKTKDVDFKTAKAIARKILIEKEKELYKTVNN